MSNLIPKWITSINKIESRDWSNLSNESAIPVYELGWLTSLEKSNSVSNETGWQPLHLSIWRNKKLIAFAPLYIKGHSFGEFIFDQSFEGLAHSLGLKYYPKLIGMSPFSPIEGYQFIISNMENKIQITELMFDIIDDFAKKNGILSCNFLYVDSTWKNIAQKFGCANWLNISSIWFSEKKVDFNQYINGFNSNQKRNIKRERASIKKAGINIGCITGNEINESIMEKIYRLYENHCSKWGAWGSKYLSEDFFQELSKGEQRDKIIIFTGFRDKKEDPIAMSLCIKNQYRLWGRYWGSKEDISNLHFELCYYTPISWALDNSIQSFDPGMGGKHKLRRGFKAKAISSLHRWYEPHMNQLIRDWLPHSNKLVLEEIESINKELPYKTKNLSELIIK